MRFLFLGDMVGRSGRTAVWERLPGLISDFKLDFVIVNGENAAGGFGITEEIFRETLDAGADVVTTGNHVWDQREALEFAAARRALPATGQFSDGHAGQRLPASSSPGTAPACCVANIMGRVFMHPELDDPFQAVERELGGLPAGRAGAMRWSSISTPRRPARRCASAISSTAAPAWSSAPTPISRPPTIRS